MPIQYSGIVQEHHAVRHAAGLFDLSHMGQFTATGDGVAPWLDELTVNAVASMRPNQARYNIFTNERGGALDDAIIYRFPEHWLIIVNAANTEKMWQWLAAAKPSDISLRDRTASMALIAVQGPRALEILGPLTDTDLGAMKYYYATCGRVAGVNGEIARTGYTGEDGFELFVAAQDAERLWDSILRQGQSCDLKPAGLGARDVLRLEAGMPLYGHELSEQITPLQARLEWAIKFDKPSFIGKDALVEQRRRGDFDVIVGFIMQGKAPARAGYMVYKDGVAVGEVRSGSPSPTLGGKNIGTALVRYDAAELGTVLQIDIRDRRHPCTVTAQPFYRRPKAA